MDLKGKGRGGHCISGLLDKISAKLSQQRLKGSHRLADNSFDREERKNFLILLFNNEK